MPFLNLVTDDCPVTESEPYFTDWVDGIMTVWIHPWAYINEESNFHSEFLLFGQEAKNHTVLITLSENPMRATFIMKLVVEGKQPKEKVRCYRAKTGKETGSSRRKMFVEMMAEVIATAKYVDNAGKGDGE